MKMNLVLAAMLAGLSSHAAFASSEGGDTWSELEPKAYSGSVQPVTVSGPVSVEHRVNLVAAPAASEGGDTWSALESKSDSTALPSLKVATTASLSTLQHENASVYGTPAQVDTADRIVRLGPDSHWVNVAYGESVEFIAQGENGAQRSFAWRFDVSPTTNYVDLSQMAPADFPDQNVRVFVAPDPRYSGD